MSVWPALVVLAAAAAAQFETVESLYRQFLVAADDAHKAEVLERLERTPPVSSREVAALHDIFSRYPDAAVRRSLMKSLAAIDPVRAAPFENLFLGYLQADESESVIFGINGALALRLEKALPVVEKIAKKKFPGKSPVELALMSDKNLWWVRYEALAALAQWRGAKVLPLLTAKAKEAPQAAGIMGTFFWEESLPQIVAWSGGKADDREKARFAASAAAPADALRRARPRMLELLRDPKQDGDLRHQLALKIGGISDESEITELVREYEAVQDKDHRLFLAAAIFASRSRQGVGILKQFAHQSPDPRARAGALFQLRDMLPAAEYRQLLEWAAKNDPDAGNREDARRQLALP